MKVGISQIYSHQLESLTALRSGKDISILTPTASGKTWCFNIAVVESCLTSNATALYLYPLKALAVDQIGKLRSLVSQLPKDEQIKVGLMTGDTSITAHCEAIAAVTLSSNCSQVKFGGF
jgi:DEAD/DEAH box helicase domain-containing protein